jgi:enoyl-CoA hydratase/carnithine racemase
MTYETLRYTVDDRLVLLELNRPDKLNAIDTKLKEECFDAFARFEADDQVRVMVLAGAGGKAFSVGYDLVDATGTSRTDIGAWRKRLGGTYRFSRLPWDCSKPVIAMIEGHCLAGGLELAQMCDIRYAADDGKFGVVETRFSAGVVTLGMPWIIGNRARELIFTGDTIGAAEAERIGLVNRVYPKAELRSEVIKTAKRISQVAMDCLVWNKRAIRNTFNTMGFDGAMEYGLEACTIMDTTHTPEFVEFARIRQEQGLNAALAALRGQFAAYE